MSTLLELSEIGELGFTPAETTLLGNFESEDQRLSAETLLSPTKIIIAASSIITGPGIFEGNIVRILFSSAITGSDTSTALSITYNGNSYPVKVGKQGALSNFVASYVNSAYTYLQAYTTLELAFDGTQFIIIGNPIVLSSSDYTIYADGENISYETDFQTNDTSRLDCYKYGKVVIYDIAFLGTGSTQITLDLSVPEDYRPVFASRGVCINNSLDIPEGQVIVGVDGSVVGWCSNGLTEGYQYATRIVGFLV